jgi:hypothetical protein
MHRPIRIAMWENVLLYVSDSPFGFLIPSFMWKKKKKLLKMLHDGKKRVEKELDIVKIMKSIRNVKILMKNSLLSKDVKF